MSDFWLLMLILGLFSIYLIVGALLRDRDNDPPKTPWENQ